jgi:hypothetical protein
MDLRVGARKDRENGFREIWGECGGDGHAHTHRLLVQKSYDRPRVIRSQRKVDQLMQWDAIYA